MLCLPDKPHGACSRAELNRLLTPRLVCTAVYDGKLTRFSRGVLVDAKRATEFSTRAAAALLLAGPEAVLTGTSALAVHGCPAAEGDDIHVLLPYHHRVRRWPGVVTHRGIQCADQALAMMSAGGARAEFRAWAEARIRARPDPRGRRQGLALLDLATGLAESPMESWLLLTIADAGLPVPDQQFEVLNLAGKPIYRLDFAWPQLRIGSEYDGRRRTKTGVRETRLATRFYGEGTG